MKTKHKHYDAIIAWANGAEIEYSLDGVKWVESDPVWIENAHYRIKPEQKTIPYTFEDAEFLIGKVVKYKTADIVSSVCEMNRTSVVLGVDFIGFQELLENYTFLDGTPCGKVV